jgi:HlyD family secretion protein
MSENTEVDSNGAVPASAGPSLSDRVRSLRLPERPTQRGPRAAWMPWALSGVLGFCTLILGTMLMARNASTLPAATSTEPSLNFNNNVPAPTASTPRGPVALESKGYIIPVHQIQVSPKVGGLVEKLTFVEGDRVKKGDVLAVLETVDYKADRDHAQGALDGAWQRFQELWLGNRPQEIEAAKADLNEAEAMKEQYYLDWKRSLQLNRQVLAPREFEQIEASYKSADRRVARLKQNFWLMLDGNRIERIQAGWHDVEQTEADLRKSQWRLDNCTVRSPIAGTILTKKAEEGNIVNPGSFGSGNGAVAASLCDMADLSDLEVDLNIQERDVANIFKGQKCVIRSEAFPGRTYQGHVSRLMPIADRAKGAVPVRVKVEVPRDEEGVYLKPEMSVLVSFLTK